MIASAALYLTLVSIAATGAALAAEAGLRRTQLQTRWAWLAALALPPLFFAASLLPPITAVMRHPTAAAVVVIPLEGFTVGSTHSGPTAADLVVGLAWATAITVMLVVLLRGHLTLVRERRGWSRTSLIGGTVYSSLDRGPAVGGLIRPWIVIPAWVLRLPPRELRMVLVHEGEHVRTGDPRLLAGALALLTLTPWNPLSWWQLRRLRAALEIDCDRRVLAQERDPRRYGHTLITVAAKLTPEPALGLAAFSESAESLQRRIVAMTRRRTRWSGPVGVGLLLFSVLLAVQACGVGPTEPESQEAVISARPLVRTQLVTPPQETAPAGSAPAPEEAPTSAGADDGAPSAEDVVRGLQERGGARDSGPDPEPAPSVARGALGPSPTFTPFDVAPNLRNRDEVAAALEREYPALLRDAGVEGRTIVWIALDENGVVQDVQVNSSSGQPALDAAALRVARQIEFSPAMNRGQVVPVWVSIPIQFQNR